MLVDQNFDTVYDPALDVVYTPEPLDIETTEVPVVPPPVKEPVYNTEPIEDIIVNTQPPGAIIPQGTQTNLVLTEYSGTVIDNTTGEELPGATVSLFDVDRKVASMAANARGEFYFAGEIWATKIVITHVSFKPLTVNANIYANGSYYLAPMEHSDELPEVVVTDEITRSDMWFYLAIAAAFAREQYKKKSVGKIDTGTVVTVGIGAAMFLGFNTLKRIFESLGFWSSAEDKAIEAEKNNPYSPWSPAFLESAPTGSWLITYATYQQMMENILAGFNWFNDDEARVIGVFKSLKTQSQLASFALHFYNTYATDLLNWLTGDDEPGADRLSNEEVNEINEFIHRLPKYIP